MRVSRHADGLKTPFVHIATIPFVAAIALLLAGIVWLATWPPGFALDLFEQGHWLGPASDMLLGKVPYRETFPVHGFLSDGGLDFLLFRLTGPSFRASGIAHQMLGIFFQPAIFLVAAAATRRPVFAAAAIPLNLALAPALVFDRPVAALLALAAFLWAVDSRPGAVPAFLSGALAALGVLYGLEYGTFVLAALLLALGLMAATRSSGLIRGRAFFGGLAGVSLPFLLWLAWRGALWDFVRTSFVDLPKAIGPVWGLRFPGPETLLAALAGHGTEVAGLGDLSPRLAARLCLAAALGVAGLAASVVLYRRRGASPRLFRLVALATACLFFFRSVFGRFHHEGGNALTGPLLLLAACLTAGMGRTMPRSRSRALHAAVFAPLILAAILAGALPSVAALAHGAMTYSSRNAVCPGCVRLTGNRAGGALVSAPDAARIELLRGFVERNAAKGPVFDLSNQPALYFFLERRNPTRFYQTALMEPFQDEVLKDLERDPPAFVFLSSGGYLDAPDGRSNESRVPRVWNWVEARYPRRVLVRKTVVALPAP